MKHAQMEQLSLVSTKKRVNRGLVFSKPVQVGDYMSIHGLIYSLKPVEGWAKVVRLSIYQPPHKKYIINSTKGEKAWIKPETVEEVYLQDYAESNAQKGHDIRKGEGAWIAWGFGPRDDDTMGATNYEMASFTFVHLEDYYRIHEKKEKIRIQKLREGG